MASSPMQMDDLVEAPRSRGSKPPITANPAFPWIVALWFACLLGIGSLIVPTTLLESVSTASGLASILPMAAPPLGITAKGLMALVGILVGGWLGLFMARKIAAPQMARVSHGKPRKPLSAGEDLDDAEFDDEDSHDDLPTPVKGRRRALAIEPEDGPSDFLDIASLPGMQGRSGHLLKVSKEIVEDAVFEQPEAEEQDVLVKAPMAQADIAEDEPFELDESAALDQPENETPEPAERQMFVPTPVHQAPVVAVNYAEPVVASATAKEPLPFSPPSMTRTEGEIHTDHGGTDCADAPTFDPDENDGPESEDTVSEKQIFHGSDASEFDMPESEPSFETGTFAEDEDTSGEDLGADDAPVEESSDEGLVQLVQRLGSTLEKHREWVAETAARKAAAPEPEVSADADFDAADVQENEAHGIAENTVSAAAGTDTPVPDEFDPAAAEDVSQAMAAYFGASPAAMASADAAGMKEADDEEPRPRYESFRGTIAHVDFDDIDDGEDDDDIADLAASFTLPLAQPPEPAPTPRPAFDRPPPAALGADEPREEPDAVPEAGTNPFKRNAEEFVRVEEPEPEEGDAEPAVLFPNQQAHKQAAPAAPGPRTFDPPVADGNVAAHRTDRPRPSNDDNDRALREALMNLQRMGK
ncbi:ABC transporter permease [Aurantiacibacter zhengii]|nr:ABC transporter permease [Aurantiacibacter zhengii]